MRLHMYLLNVRVRARKSYADGTYGYGFPKGTAAARPFRIEDGKAYGPGVMDMKAGIAISLYTVKALLDNGWDDTDLTLFFCGDEEPAHPLTDAVEWFKKKVWAKMLFSIWNQDAQTAV